MDSFTLELQVKSVYGVDRIYPINDQAKRVIKLLGRKTFAAEEVSLLKEIGFKIVWTPISI